MTTTSVFDQIQVLFDKLTPNEKDLLSDKISALKEMINRSSHPFRALRQLYQIADEANKSVQRVASCKAGCSHCCNIRVACSSLEAKLIIAYCKQNDITIDIDKLEHLKDLDEHQYMFSPHKRCTFLSDKNTCNVYEVRPMSCRNYYVTNHPDKCNTDIYPHGKTSGIFDWESTIPAIALITVAEDGTHASLPKRILTELANH